MRESSCIELKKLHKSCIEQERIKVTERFEAKIEVVIDENTFPTLSKKAKISLLAS